LARRIGVQPAETRAMLEVLERAGRGAQAQSELAKFAQTMGDVQRGAAGVRGELQRLGFEGVTKGMEGLFDQIRKLPDLASQWDAIREFARVQGEAEARRSGGAAGVYEKQILDIIGAPSMQSRAVGSMKAALAEIDDIRRKSEARAIEAGEKQLELVGKIHAHWKEIARYMGTDIMEGKLGQGLKWIDEKLEAWKNALTTERRGVTPSGEPLAPSTRNLFDPRRIWDPNEIKRERQLNPNVQWPKSPGGFTEPFGGEMSPQRLMGSEGVKGFTGPYAPMTPQSWKGAADWAEQLHGDYSTNIERRDLQEEENAKTRELVNALKRANALLSGEEQPKPGGALGLLTTQMGGLGPGMGGSRGVGGVPPMGAAGPPGRGGPPGGAPPSGTNGTPSVAYPALGTAELSRVSYAGVQGLPGAPSGPAPGRPAQVPEALPRQGLAGGPSGPAVLPPSRGGGPSAPLPGGTGSSALYNKLLAAYKNSSLVGTIPADGARFGFKTGSAEEWARFGMIIAAAESDYNPKTAVSNRQEQSFGVFQYNHPQVPGGNAFDVDASVKQFVTDSESSMKSHGGFRPGSILYRRFSTIQNTPPLSRARQADEAIRAAQQQPAPPAAQQSPTGPDYEPIGSRAPRNILQSQGVQPIPASQLSQVKTELGTYKVYPPAAQDFQNFTSDLLKLGAPIRTWGTHNIRQMRHGRLWSTHSYANAFDVDNEEHFSPQMAEWVKAHPNEWRDVLRRNNMAQPYPGEPGRLRDEPHIEWVGNRPGATPQETRVAGPPQMATQPPQQRITTPRINTSPAGTLTETPSGSTWTAAESRAEIDRSVIDSIAGARMRHRAIGSANIDVNVKSEGQKSVTQTGPFRKVRLSRDTGMTKSSSGPAASSGATGESHDPSLDS
jgi:hypothetical protein